VSTQLRLVEPPAPTPRRTAARAQTARVQPGRRRGRAATGRRVVHWGEWRLDAQTRQVGRAGVAEARRALAAASDHDLSRAS